MRRFPRIALALATATGLAQPATAAQPFSNIYFFGDSLTDAGFYGARFTVNPGQVWAQDFGARYGLTVRPVTQGGTDFAQGGERVTQPSPLTAPGAPDRPLSTQIGELLQASAGRLDPNALYTVWIGANDIFANVAAAAAGQISAAQVQANVATAATETLQQVARLRDAGARNVMVFNLPDIGRTPQGFAQPTAPYSALSGLYNSTLQAGLEALGVNIIPINISGLLSEVIAAPAQFGLANVTAPACTTASSITCSQNTLVAPNAGSSFLFADGVHPTPAGHQLIADYAAAVVSAPAQAGLLAEAPLQVEQSNFRAIDGRMISAVLGPRAPGKYEAYAVYDYGNYDRSGDLGGGDSTSNSIVAGGDIKLSEHLLAGFAFGYTENKASLGSDQGGFKLNEATGTLYAGYGYGPWYAGVTVGAGDLDFRSIRRTFSLGPSTRTETGDTHGTHVMARILGGYSFNLGTNWLHGPFARFTYQEARVYAWSENGASSTAMTFGHQKRESLASSLGWQASGNLGRVRPFARATWEKDYDDDNRSVTAGLVSMPGKFSMPVARPDDSYALFTLGASTEFGARVTGFVTVNLTAAKNDGNDQAVTVGVRVPL